MTFMLPANYGWCCRTVTLLSREFSGLAWTNVSFNNIDAAKSSVCPVDLALRACSFSPDLRISGHLIYTLSSHEDLVWSI
jgi:hypothetical protein